MSVPQQVKCMQLGMKYGEFKVGLATALAQASSEDMRQIVDALENDRLQGNIMAMLGLAAIYETGLGGVPINVNAAADLYLDAAFYGSLDGMLGAAMIYCDGRISAPDLECFYLLRNAAELGRTDALLVLADQLVRKNNDFDGAQTYLEKAVKLGVPGAKLALTALLNSRT